MFGLDFNRFKDCLKEQAFDSSRSKGRKNGHFDCDMFYDGLLDPFILDAYKIEQSQARYRSFRKTQVFYLPENPHIRNRGFHSDGLSAGAVCFAEITGLNVALSQAIAKWHDVGHPPLGHMGEKFISEKSGRNFQHATMSVVLAQEIESEGRGMNLCFETLEGSLLHDNHTPEELIALGYPLEYGSIKGLDRIDYVFWDIEDVMRMGFVRPTDLPPETMWLGKNRQERTLRCIHAFVEESCRFKTISFSDSDVAVAFRKIREWMFKEVYLEINKLFYIYQSALDRAYDFFSADDFFRGVDPAIVLALLTDGEVGMLSRLFRKKKALSTRDLKNFGIMEIVPHIRGKNIDFTKADLSWGEKLAKQTA